MNDPVGVNEHLKYNTCEEYKEETTTTTTTAMKKSAARSLAEKPLSLSVIMLGFFFLLS